MKEFDKIFPIADTKTHLNEMVRAINGVSPLVGYGPVTVTSGAGGATVSVDPKYVGLHFFVGKVISKYPDYDARYTVQPVYIPAFTKDNSVNIFEKLELISGSDPQNCTVTNLAEFRPDPISVVQVPSPTNQLMIGQYVRVWLEQSRANTNSASAIIEEPFWVMHEVPYTLYEGCTDSPGSESRTYSRHKTAVRFDKGFTLQDDSTAEDEVLVSLNLACCSGITVSYGEGSCPSLHLCWDGLYVEDCDKSYQEHTQAIIFGSGLKVSDTTTTVLDCDGEETTIQESKVELCLEAGDGITIEPGVSSCCYKISAPCCYSGMEVGTSCGGTTQGGITNITFGDGIQVGYPAVGEATVDVCIHGAGDTLVSKSGCCYTVSSTALSVGDCLGHIGVPIHDISFGDGFVVAPTGDVALVDINIVGAGNVTVTHSCGAITVSGTPVCISGGSNVTVAFDGSCYSISTSGCCSLDQTLTVGNDGGGQRMTNIGTIVCWQEGVGYTPGTTTVNTQGYGGGFFAYDNGHLTPRAVLYTLYGDCYVGGNYVDDSLIFLAGGAEKARITNDTGNLGVGTTAPADKLDVAGTGGALGAIVGPTDANVGYVNVRSGSTFWHLSNRASSGSNRFGLYYNNGSGFSSELVTVQTGGNVGINNSSPSYKLDVDGDINTSTLYRVGTVPGITTTNSRVTNITCHASGSGNTVYFSMDYDTEVDTFVGGILVGTAAGSTGGCSSSFSCSCSGA